MLVLQGEARGTSTDQPYRAHVRRELNVRTKLRGETSGLGHDRHWAEMKRQGAFHTSLPSKLDDRPSTATASPPDSYRDWLHRG